MNTIRILSLTFCFGLLISPLQQSRSMAVLPFVSAMTGSSLFAPTLAVTALVSLFAYGKWREHKLNEVHTDVRDIQGRVIGLERITKEEISPAVNDLRANAARKTDVESLQTGINERFTQASQAAAQQFAGVRQDMGAQERRLTEALNAQGHNINEFTKAQIETLKNVFTTDLQANKQEVTRVRELIEGMQKENAAAQEKQAGRDAQIAEHTQHIKTVKEQQDTLIMQNAQIISYFESLKQGGIAVTLNSHQRRQLPMGMSFLLPHSTSSSHKDLSKAGSSNSAIALLDTPSTASTGNYSLLDFDNAIGGWGKTSLDETSTALVPASSPF